MNMERTATRHTVTYKFRSQLREKARKAEILVWYLCYRVVSGSNNKETPGKSLSS